MALNLDNSRTEPDELMLCPVQLAYLDSRGNMWHRTPSIKRPMLTSACLLSSGRSLPVFASPPHRRDEPRTSSKLDNMEPKSDHFKISNFSLCRAKSAIISSGTFPHVAFRIPPAEIIPK